MSDALQLLVEVILLPLAWRVLQALIIHREALHQILVQAPDGPLPKLRSPMAAHAETDGHNRVQIVVLHFTGHLPRPLDSNYPDFPDSCLPPQFTFVENVHQMLVDRAHILLEQFRDERLCQPPRLVFKPALARACGHPRFGRE